MLLLLPRQQLLRIAVALVAAVVAAADFPSDAHCRCRGGWGRYNKNRMDMLRQIVEREQECIEYRRKQKEKEDRYFQGLQETCVARSLAIVFSLAV